MAASRRLPRSRGFSGYWNVVGHPGVHAEVEVRHHEDRRLEPLRQVERRHRELVALLRRTRDEHDVLRVAVRQDRRRQDVALRRARGQARGRPDALHVDDDRGDLGVVAQAHELAHERDARAGRRRHRTRAGPSRAERHADRRQFVLGLHDGKGGLPRLLVHPVLLQVLDQASRRPSTKA